LIKEHKDLDVMTKSLKNDWLCFYIKEGDNTSIPMEQLYQTLKEKLPTITSISEYLIYIGKDTDEA
jgi:hypothetical protein